MAQTFNDGQGDALQALLNSLGSTEFNGQKASPELVQRMAERLNAMLGEEEPNEGGEDVHASGLPRLEVIEPTGDEKDLEVIPEEEPLVPLSGLTPELRAQRKAEMDRILSELEEEEGRVEEREYEREKERGKALVEKRKLEAEERKRSTAEKIRREKKMGKALLSTFSGSPNQNSSSSTPPPAPTQNSKQSQKKSVKFDDEVTDMATVAENPKLKMEWGDVVAALPSSSSRRLFQTNVPMKMEVVERPPRGVSMSRLQRCIDSDDESDDASHLDSKGSPSTSGALGKSNPNNDPVDIDDILHREEIAREYALRRDKISANGIPQTIAELALSDTNRWDQENVPLNATLSSSPPKTKKSRFKTSIQNPLLPSITLDGKAISGVALRNAVRIGNLENGRLVASGADDSASDEDAVEHELVERTKQVLLSDTLPPSLAPRVASNRPSEAEESHSPFPTISVINPEPIQQATFTRPSPNPPVQPPALSTSSLIVESPSFAAPRVSSNTISPPVMVHSVRESSRQPPVVQPSSVTTKKVSRFKAERS